MSLQIVFTVLVLLSLPGVTRAYGGPGSIISGIGAFLAVLATIFVSIIGFLWYPIKRLLKKLFGKEED